MGLKINALAAILLGLSTTAQAVPITWIGKFPDNDMNDPANWSTNTVPGTTDDALFDSKISNIAKNPTESSAPFEISSIQFLHSASAFTFHFENQTLTFSGLGLVGTHTDTVFNILNIDNSDILGDQVFFDVASSSMGSSVFTITNSANVTGNLSGLAIGNLNSQLNADALEIKNNGKITVVNEGIDSTTGTGNNTIAFASKQIDTCGTIQAGDNVTISITNSGTFSGSTSADGNMVGRVVAEQFSTASFQAGDNFSFTAVNSGTNSSTGFGDNQVGYVSGIQTEFRNQCVLGKNSSLTISNTGFNSGQGTNPNFVGYVTDQQFYVEEAFTAGDGLSFLVENSGTDSSTGTGGHNVGIIDSNSGTTGTQAQFHGTLSVENDASIHVHNSGTYNGTNTVSGSRVGNMNAGQLLFEDVFTAGNKLDMHVSNSGSDTAHGVGQDAIAAVSGWQTQFDAAATVGDEASILITNLGFYGGSNSATYNNVGSVGGGQFRSVGNFEAGDSLRLEIGNGAYNQSTGIGGNFIGMIIGGNQARFEGTCTVKKDAVITIANEAINFGTATNSVNMGGSLTHGQMVIEDAFQASDNLDIAVSNIGIDVSSQGPGSYTAIWLNGTNASQLHFGSTSTLGENASISIRNGGYFQGNNATAHNVGVLSNQQFCATSAFNAGDLFSIGVSNEGISDAFNENNNAIATVGLSQIHFKDTCTLGDHATVQFANAGTNADLLGTGNTIGYINGSQLQVDGTFTASKNLFMTAFNLSSNDGDASNNVGFVNGAQILFNQNFTAGHGSVVFAENTGTIAGSQMVFNQGFTIPEGRIDIEVLNSGVVNNYGILVQGANAGGNAGITLGNSPLSIATTLPSFTIGGLDGDATSTAESSPTLIINTDATIKANFSGTIQDFTATNSRLVKQGPGSQKLSGINTYTGLTTVEEGSLVITGSIAGDVFVDSLGILKGTGIIGGNVLNMGTISPGESIGTLNFLGNYTNNGGTYEVEVNGAGQSDLINVQGTAFLNGGLVSVSSVDGTFQFATPYTIVTAGGVAGTYTGASSLAFVRPTLTYDATHVYLTLASDLIRAAESCNQIGVAENIDSISLPNDAETRLISVIANLSLKDAREALESLSGFQYTNEVWAQEIATQRLLRRVYSPLRGLVSGCEKPACTEWTAWLEAGDGFTHVKGKAAHKMNMNSFNVTGGVQKSLCYDITLGLAGSYESDSIKLKHAKTERDNEYLIAYGLYRPSSFYALADLVYGHASNDYHRKFDTGDVHYKIHSKPHLDSFTFYSEAGFDVKSGCLTIQPFVGLQAGTNERSSIKENGSFGLSIKKQDWNSCNARLGVHFAVCNLCNAVDASLDLAWNALLSSHKNTAKGRFKEFGETFRICGNRLDQSSFDYAFALESHFCKGLRGYLEVSGQTWEHANTIDVAGGIKYSW